MFRCSFVGQGFSPAEWPLSPCFHPHSLRSDWFRSVHVGRSRFSRCCHLFIALWFCSWRVETRASAASMLRRTNVIVVQEREGESPLRVVVAKSPLHYLTVGQANSQLVKSPGFVN